MSIVLEVRCICDAPDCAWYDRTLVMKLSCPSESREAEGEHIKYSREKAKESARWALIHLPEVLDCVTFKYDETNTPQGTLGKAFEYDNNRFEIRVWRVTILEKLEPLNALKNPKEYAQVFYDILQGATFSFVVIPATKLRIVHRWLSNEVKILHRDLSPGNIMFRRSASGQVYGVLNDFDLASRLDIEHDGPTSNQRTGTRPYMALDLLDSNQPSVHRYRHDLESLFYIILCLACRYEKPGVRLENPPFMKWFLGTDEDVFFAKYTEISRKRTFAFARYFSAFSEWVNPLHQMLSHAIHQQDMSAEGTGFDLDTLNGMFTYDRVKEVMCTFGGVALEERWK